MKIRKVACVGAGLIGQGWATLFSAKGLEVNLQDLEESILQVSMERLAANLSFLETNGLLGPGGAAAALERVRTTTELAEAVAGADYVQESVVDDYEIKRNVFEKMDAAAPDHAILASSASGLMMTPIQGVTHRPERCILVHPMLPVHLIPAVEIAGGEGTSRRTIERTREFMNELGKTPVVLNREVPGYIVNRLQAALLREAIDLVDRGVASAEDVDNAFRLGVGLRDPLVGPFLRVHLAGDGMERFLENYARSYRYRWETMAAWTSIPPSAAEAMVKGVHEMKLVREKSLEEIKAWRDQMLVRILKLLNTG